MYSKMLVTLDRSKASETVLKHIERAAGPETQVTLLTVTEVPPSLALSGPALLRRRQASAVNEEARYLEKTAKPLRERGLHVETQVALGDCKGPWVRSLPAASSGRDSAAEQILKVARDLGADVIVMATHGHGALAKTVFGSVTERVLRSGICPVLLVRPDKLK
jgi:nucleotide-binding universal stress UspA family protein